MLPFEWGEKKNGVNRTKHGVWFEEAQSVFRDTNARLFHDPEHSEERGSIYPHRSECDGKASVVIPCYRESDSLIRIISARKASKKEVRFYEEGV
jgi:uncharacterized protein